MFKRILSSLIITTLTIGSFGMSFADENTMEITSEDKINSLLKKKVISGYGDGTIRLEKSITRGEFSTVLAKIIIESEDGDEKKTIEEAGSQNYFTDLDKDSKLNSYINILFEKGIISGYSDNTFRPNNKITFSEVIAMVIRVLDIEIEKGETWSQGYINKAEELGILKGIEIEEYSDVADRQKVFELIYNKLELNE